MTDPRTPPEPFDESTPPEASPHSGATHPVPEDPDEPGWPSETPDTSETERMDTTDPATVLVGCTVVSRDQIPAARVLRDSFLAGHAGARFITLLMDHPDALDERERAEFLTPMDIGVDAVEFARLALACTAEQLRGVIRPRLLTNLLESGATVLYLDPSVRVFAGFGDIVSEVTPQRPVALVPRVLRPLFRDGLRPSTTDLAEAGTFDSSMVVVGPGAERFLALWAEQVRADPAGGGDFLEGAPALVDHHVLRDPGVGLSAFNAAQRELEASPAGGYTVDGTALRSVHFTGFEPQRPWLFSANYADRPRVLLSENPLLARLCAAYRNALVMAGYTAEQPHAFRALPDGFVIPDALRGEYLSCWLSAEQTGEPVPVSPFEPREHDPVEAFLDWACAPAGEWQRAAGASRWTAAVWADDALLQRDYPDPFGADATSFREWCIGVGTTNLRVPQQAVRHPSGEGRTPLVDQLGVAVLGTGRVAELLRVAVRASGLPSADTPSYPVVVRCDFDQPVPAGRHLIDVLPTGEHSPRHAATETWALSETGRQAVRRAGYPAPRVITLPLPDRGQIELASRKGARAQCGLSDEFVIGSFADHSDEHRGNVLGLVNAFFAAFEGRTDVRLLIGVRGAEAHPEAAERLRLATTADTRVLLVEHDEQDDVVLAACDCVVSLHRPGDGSGGDYYALGLLEAAARGVPVMAGDHGAVSELLGDQGARLVPCLGAGEPDIDRAAALLTEAADAPDDIAEFGLRAREHLLAGHSAARTGEGLRDRVEHAYRSWRTKWSGDHQSQQDDPLRPLSVARHALHRSPDVSVGGRNAMAPALRKAVLKALGHYDEHIRDILGSLVDGVERTAAELLRRQHEAGGEGDTESLHAELTRLTHRQEQLDAQLESVRDETLRTRSELVGQNRRLDEIERQVPDHAEDDGRIDALGERVDRLAAVVERTLDRMETLDEKLAESNRAQQQRVDTELRTASHDAAHALRQTDVLRRILLREHERGAGAEDDTSKPVVCDAGLLRLPADDTRMLPWLSSHVSWDAEVSA
ncbi:hypothetical protein FHX42_002909, partial [Saccharopolyspora lacisalsi]